MTVHTETPEVATGNRTTRAEAIEVVKVDPTTSRTKVPRAITDEMTIPTAANKVAMDDLTTPMGVTVAVMANLTPTEVVSKVTVDLTTTLALMVDRRNEAVAEVTVLSGAMMTRPAATARDINPDISRRIRHRRTLILLETPTPPEEAVRRKPVTTPRAATEAAVLMEVTKEGEAIARKVTKSTAATPTQIRRLTVLRS